MGKLFFQLKGGHGSHVVEGRLKTVRDLKSHIAECHGIPFNEQILVHDKKFLDFNGKELAKLDGKIKVYRKFSAQNIQIKVLSQNNDDIYLDVISNQSVLELKMLIDEKLGLSPHRQSLSTMESDTFYEQDTLDEYIIQKNPSFILNVIPIDKAQELHIRLEKNGLFNSVYVENSDTVYTLHGEARRQGLASGYGFYFQWNQERLLGSNFIGFYSIPNGSTIHLVEEEDGDE